MKDNVQKGGANELDQSCCETDDWGAVVGGEEELPLEEAEQAGGDK